MKFLSIAAMLQHIRTTHTDRINSPNSYIEQHFGRVNPNNYHTANSVYKGEEFLKRKTEDNLYSNPIHNQYLTVKTEQDSPKSDRYLQQRETRRCDSAESTRQTPFMDSDHSGKINEHTIKQEGQDSPTDLSNKKPLIEVLKDSRSKSPNETNNNNNIANNNDNNNASDMSPVDTHFHVQSKRHTTNQPHNQMETFLCNQCNAALPNFEAFRNHLKTHLTIGEIGNYVCQHCGLALTNQTEYERHCISHYLIQNTEFSCTLNCNKTFSKSEDLQKHLLDIHAQNLWKCNICSELFDSKVAIQVHFAIGHVNELKTFRCSACMETFKTEQDIKHHIRSCHTPVSASSLQCVFCRTVCATELEMHFHLAAHARQYRCPACPEAFHVEFLLDRHMQTHHCGAIKDQLSAQYKTINNNNNILDYHYAVASGGKGLYPFANRLPGKIFNPLQIDTNMSALKTPNHLYGLYDSLGKSRYNELASKNLMSIYNNSDATKFYLAKDQLPLPPPSTNTVSVTNHLTESEQHYLLEANKQDFYNLRKNFATPKNTEHQNQVESNFICGICERSDFNSEAEVHTHRKVAHNVKTGVSLKCAYCNDNFRSR